MKNLIVREAIEDDAPILASLINEFVKGHPAENHPRPLKIMREAYFSGTDTTHINLAIKDDTVIGFCGWRKIYDMFWAVYGGDAIGLYINPQYRGQGIAAILVATMCSEIRDSGGKYLHAVYDDKLSRFYDRVAVGRPTQECHLSASAFQAVADLAGCSAREIVRNLPNKELNYKN